MISVLVFLDGPKGSPHLAQDLEAAGLLVQAVVSEVRQLVPGVVRHAPDVVVADVPLPGDALFKATLALTETAPLPVVVFTADLDARRMAQAVESGVHAYVVNGYGAQRLRPLVHLAQARFRRENALREELREVSVRFEERKLVDRAKGILMRARQIADDEAYQILRSASMQTQQRLGQVSQHIVFSAHYAEGVNRAGQLRMLSQRVLKLHLLRLAGVEAARHRALLDESAERIEANLALLHKNLSQPTFGDLLAPLSATWARLSPLLREEPVAGSVAPADALAEQLLRDADRLTASLENAGSVAPLRALNTAGRQRMLSQRYAKCALLALADPAAVAAHAAAMDEARQGFEQGLAFLESTPLSTPDIRQALDAATRGWQQMLAGAAQAERASGGQRQDRLAALATASEELLAVFERLSAQYERSMQMLMG